MVRRGFTVVEIIIIITIMGILLTLSVVNLTATQVNGRDSERAGDVEALATNLETYYRTGAGNPNTLGRYPSTEITVSEAALTSVLKDIDLKSVTAPNSTGMAQTFRAANNNNQTPTGVDPSPTMSQYVYQPLQTNGALCTLNTQECRKFNIFYRLESTNTVVRVTSKNQ